MTQSWSKYKQSVMDAAVERLIPMGPAPLFLRKRQLAVRVEAILREAAISGHPATLRTRIRLAGAVATTLIGAFTSVALFPLVGKAQVRRELSTDTSPNQSQTTLQPPQVDADVQVLGQAEKPSVQARPGSAPTLSAPAQEAPALTPPSPTNAENIARPAYVAQGAFTPQPIHEIAYRGLSDEMKRKVEQKLNLVVGDMISLSQIRGLNTVARAEVDESLVVSTFASPGIKGNPRTFTLGLLIATREALQAGVFSGDPSVPATIPIDALPHAVGNDAAFNIDTEIAMGLLTTRVEPVSIAIPRLNSRQNSVEVSAIVRTDGTVRDAYVLNRADPAPWQPALDAVTRWQFHPMVLDGKPVEFHAILRVPIVLSGAPQAQRSPANAGPVAFQVQQNQSFQEPSTNTAIVFPQAEAARLRIRFVPPTYPPVAKTTRIEGTVLLKALIGEDGTVRNLTVLDGPPLLRQPSLEAVSQWIYQPYQINGQPVEFQTEITIDYSLR